jgi:hypothetical protein
MNGEVIALFGLGFTLLCTVIASAITVGKMLEMQRTLAEKEKEQDQRLARLDQIPTMQVTLAHVERNHSLIPKLQGEVEVLKAQQKHSSEMRRVMMRSRPDADEEDNES